MNQAQATPDVQRLYRELVLEHSRNPRHFGRIDNATHSAEGINRLCGDKLRLYLRIDDSGTIAASGFEGSGCAISVASASLLTDAVNGVSIDTASDWFHELTKRLSGQDTARAISPGLQALAALDGVRDFPGRIKCATLAWHTLSAALNKQPSPVSTE